MYKISPDVAIHRPQKSLFFAYVCWLFGGIFGLHHLYLERDTHAFLTWATVGGYFGVGWFRDMWMLPEYVRDHNESPVYMEQLVKRMRGNPKPEISWARKLGSLIVANAFGYLILGALPLDEIDNEHIITLLKMTFIPFASGFGVYLVGNVGRHRGPLRTALIGAYFSVPLYMVYSNPVLFTSIFSICIFNRYGLTWRRHYLRPQNFCSRAYTLMLMGTAYLALWAAWFCLNCTTTSENGEQIKCYNHMVNFFKSPSWQQTLSAFEEVKLYIRVHGISGLYRELKELMGSSSVEESYDILGLSSNSSQEEIRERYKKLCLKYHPDKQKTDEDRAIAQEKFIEIKEAYHILSKKKRT